VSWCWLRDVVDRDAEHPEQLRSSTSPMPPAPLPTNASLPNWDGPPASPTEAQRFELVEHVAASEVWGSWKLPAST
jgi:hypothetical protein